MLRLNINEVYCSLTMKIKSALIEDLPQPITQFDKEIEVYFCNPDILHYLRKKCYFIKDDHLYFRSLIEFFNNIHSLSLVLNVYIAKLYKVNTSFLRVIEEFKINNDLSGFDVGEITRKSVVEITYEDRLIVLKSLGLAWQTRINLHERVLFGLSVLTPTQMCVLFLLQALSEFKHMWDDRALQKSTLGSS